MLLNNELAKQKSEIAFIKITADGFDLGSSKRVVSKNDLPKAIKLLDAWAVGKLVDDSIFSLVGKQEIAIGGDYNLGGDRYKVGADYSLAKWPMAKLSDICKISAGNSAPQSEAAFEGGTYPFFRTSDVGAVHLSTNLTKVNDYLNTAGTKGMKLFEKGTILFPKSGASTFLNHRAIMGTDGYVASHLGTINVNPELASTKYVYFVLTRIDAKALTADQTYPSLRLEDIGKIEIPLPPLEVQETIVAELEGYAAIISGAKQVVDNWKPRVDVDPSWEKSTIQEICTVNPKKSEIKNIETDSLVSFVPMSDVNENDMYFKPLESKKLMDVGGSYTYFAENDILLAKVTPCFENGKLGIARNLENGVGFGSSEFIVLRTSSVLLPEILASYLMEPAFKINGKMKMTGTGGLQRLPLDFVMNFEVPIPPAELQSEIVAGIMEEKHQVEAARKLIDSYQERSEMVIAKLWSE